MGRITGRNTGKNVTIPEEQGNKKDESVFIRKLTI